MAKRRAYYARALESRMMLDASLPTTTDLVLNLDASDSTSILDDGGGSISDGESVSAWNNLITTDNDDDGDNGESFDATQSDTRNMPTYNVSGINGNPSLAFGGGSSLSFDSLDVGNDFTIFYVAVAENTNAPQAILSNTAVSTFVSSNYKSDGSFNYLASDGSEVAIESADSGGKGIAPQIVTFLGNSSGHDFLVDGATLSGLDTDSKTGSVDLNGLELVGSGWIGQISQILVYNRELTATEQEDVENYLAFKWGLTSDVDPNSDDPTLNTNTGANVADGGSVTITSAMLSVTDTDNSDTATYIQISALPANGTLFLNGSALSVGDLVSQDEINNNLLTYTHDSSSNNDSFSFTVTDLTHTSSTDTFTLTRDNTAPAAADDSFSTKENSALTISASEILSNDTDPDGDSLSISALSNAVNGSVVLVDGNVVFTPNANFFGTASFDYTASDGIGGTSTGTVTITVNEAIAATNADTVTESGFESTTSDSSTATGVVTVTSIDPVPLTQDLTLSAELLAPSLSASGDSAVFARAYYGGSLQTVQATVESSPLIQSANAPANAQQSLQSFSESIADDSSLTSFLDALGTFNTENPEIFEELEFEEEPPQTDIPLPAAPVDASPAQTESPDETPSPEPPESPEEAPASPDATQSPQASKAEEFSLQMARAQKTFASEVDNAIGQFASISQT